MRRLRRTAEASALAVAGVGTTVLIGWALDAPRLTRLAPGLASIKANTAAGLVGCGMALAIRADRRHRRPVWNRVALLLAWLTILGATLTLVEASTGFNLHIDELVFHDSTVPAPRHPGRPATATTACLLCVAAALPLLNRHTTLGQFLAVPAASVSGLSLLGHAYGVAGLYRAGPYASLGLHTAGAVLALSVGVLMVRPLRCVPDLFIRRSRGGELARRLLPATVGIPLAAGWACLAGYHANRYAIEFAFALFAVACIGVFSVVVLVNVKLMDRSDGRRRLAEADRDGLLVRERAARALAERAVAARDQLLSVVSHELRTPLTPVLLVAAQLARHDGLPPDVRNDLAMICDQVQVEGRLIDDLLDLVSLRQAKVSVAHDRLDAAALVRDCVAVFTSSYAQKGVSLQDSWAAQGPGTATVVGDAGRLRQVLGNLLANALKFTPARGTVSVRCWTEAGQLIVEVADTGIGIAADAMGRIFDDFEQADPSTTRRYGGLGLGLAISRRLIDLHGGTLTADSDGPDQGARFRLSLPLALPTALPVPLPRWCPAAPANGRHEPTPPPIGTTAEAGRRILLVEDNPLTLRLLSRLLGSRGHHVASAPSAKDALATIGAASTDGGPFDLLISDIGLPDVDGWDLMRQVRSAHPDLQGIALSGFVSDADRQRSADSGFAEHLGKPVDVPKLIRAIGTLTAAAEPALAGVA